MTVCANEGADWRIKSNVAHKIFYHSTIVILWVLYKELSLECVKCDAECVCVSLLPAPAPPPALVINPFQPIRKEYPQPWPMRGQERGKLHTHTSTRAPQPKCFDSKLLCLRTKTCFLNWPQDGSRVRLNKGKYDFPSFWGNKERRNVCFHILKMALLLPWVVCIS